MVVSLYRRRVAATVIELAKDDPSLVKEVIARLRAAGEIELDDLVYLDRIAERSPTIAPTATMPMKMSFRMSAVSRAQSVLPPLHSANRSLPMLCLEAEIATRNSALDPSSPYPLRKHRGRDVARPTSPQQPRQRLSLLREFLRVRLLQLPQVVQLPAYSRKFGRVVDAQQWPLRPIRNQGHQEPALIGVE